MREYFFKAFFGLWWVLKSLFIGGVTGFMLAVVISFCYYYVCGQFISHWFAATCVLMASISVFWMYADFKPTMARAAQVTKMGNDEIISQIVSRVMFAIVILLICTVLYGVYLWTIK